MVCPSQYSPLRHLALSLGWKGKVGVFTGYFDEGGDEHSYPFVMGGLVIDAENIQQFDDDWREAIKELPFHPDDGHPRLHTTDFINGSENFSEWKGRYEEKLRILTNAARVIYRHSPQVFTCDLNMNDYNSLDTEWKISECLGHPYGLLTRGAMDQLKGWAYRSGVSHRPQMVLEERHGIGEVIELFIADGIKPPQTGGKEMCALQAADYIAFMRLTKLRPTQSSVQVQDSWREVNKYLCDYLPINKPEIVGICQRLQKISGREIPRREDSIPVKYHSNPNRPRYRFKNKAKS